MRVPVEDQPVTELAQEETGSPEPGQVAAQPSVPANRSTPTLQVAQRPVGMHVFISYAHEDREKALEIKRTLEKGGLEVFIDTESLRAGVQWPPALRRAIAMASRFLLVWSAHAAKSEWVRKEFTYALDLRRDWDDPFIQLHPLDETELPKELRTIQVPQLQQAPSSKRPYYVVAALVLAGASALAVALHRGKPNGDAPRPVASAPSTQPSQITKGSDTSATNVATVNSIAAGPLPTSASASSTTVLSARSHTARRTSAGTLARHDKPIIGENTQSPAVPSATAAPAATASAPPRSCKDIRAECNEKSHLSGDSADECTKRQGCPF